jgi:hypothetical protein
MKELVKGIWSLAWAIVVSLFMFTIGTLYSIGYAIWLGKKAKKHDRRTAVFRYIWRLIDGFAAAIGHALYEIAYALDLAWNVNGEIIEDFVTAKEDTTFTEKNISVSASIGKLEIDNDLNERGKVFSKILNIFFWQKQHAVDAWNYTIAQKELKNQYFEKL